MATSFPGSQHVNYNWVNNRQNKYALFNNNLGSKQKPPYSNMNFPKPINNSYNKNIINKSNSIKQTSHSANKNIKITNGPPKQHHSGKPWINNDHSFNQSTNISAKKGKRPNSLNNSSYWNGSSFNDSILSNRNLGMTSYVKKKGVPNFTVTNTQRSHTPNIVQSSKTGSKGNINFIKISNSVGTSPNVTHNIKMFGGSDMRSHPNIHSTNNQYTNNQTNKIKGNKVFQPKNIFSNFKRKKTSFIVQGDQMKMNKMMSMNNSSSISGNSSWLSIPQKSNSNNSNIKIQHQNNNKNTKTIIEDSKEVDIEFTEENQPKQQIINTNLNNNNYVNYNNSQNKQGISRGKIIKCIHDLSKTGMSGDEKRVNQDNYFIFKNFNNSLDNIFMGVLDGHGYYGHEVSGYIRENLPMNWNHMIKANKIDLGKDDVSDIISKTFVNENYNLLRNKMIDSTLSGTTCVSTIYTPKKLIVANIGDSRIVLGKCLNNKQWKALNLSRDHKPSLEDEADRILKKGGRIRPMKDDDGSFIGPLRVYMRDKDMPGLAMTRSFGDYYASTAGTISTPEVTEYVFQPEDKFIVWGSDGWYEFIESDEVVDIIKNYYTNDDIVGGCEYWYKESCRRWIKNEEDTIDDITIILVFFE